MRAAGWDQRIARTLVRIASLLAPAAVRRDWQEEWLAELWHEAGNAPAGGALVRAATGAFPDALAMHVLRGVTPAPARLPVSEWGTAMIRESAQAMRALRRSPGFALIAIFTLALGLGANGALFTVVQAVVLQPLRFFEPDRLVRIEHPTPGMDPTRPWPLSMHGYFHLADNNRTLESLGVYMTSVANVASADAPPERLALVSVSASFFTVLRAKPHLGQLFTEQDNRPGASPGVVLGYGYWQRRFGGDASVVGKQLKVNGVDREIIGVAQRGLQPPDDIADLWAPLWLDRAQRPVNSHIFAGIARLAPAASVSAAQADLLRLTKQFPEVLPEAYSQEFMEKFGFTVRVVPLRDDVIGEAAKTLWIVFGAVGLVLLIACANVANLFLVRSEARRREVAVRAALGATRAQLARFFLAESIALALIAGLLGLGLAWLGVRTLVAVAPEGVPRITEITLGPLTVLFTVALALITGFLFGLFPVLRFKSPQLSRQLQEGSIRVTTSRSGHRMRSWLVGAQIALAVVLLAGAGLLVKSFQRLRSVDTGFDAANVLTFEVALSRQPYDTPDRWNQLYERFLEGVRVLPGVSAVGAATSFPLKDIRGCFALFVQDSPQRPGEPPRCITTVFVTPGWFKAMGIPVDGREFEWRDNQLRSGPALVSRSLAARLWPGQNAMNRGVLIGSDQLPYFRVVGIAGDVRALDLTEPMTEIAYFPIVPNAAVTWWFPPHLMTIAVRTTRADPATLMPEIRSVLAEVDRDIPIANVRPAEAILGRSLARVSFVLMLLGIAAAVALVLGSVGLYGVIAYVVGQRRSEIGLRMALGARIMHIAQLVLFQSLRIAVAGIIVGVLAALVATRVLGSMLFDVSPTDPVTLVGVGALLLVIALLASSAPAWRAARVDPAESLRGG